VKPQIACPDVRSLPRRHVHPGRRDRPAADGVPGHCRVTGHHRAGDSTSRVICRDLEPPLLHERNGGFAGEGSRTARRAPPCARPRCATAFVTATTKHRPRRDERAPGELRVDPQKVTDYAFRAGAPHRDQREGDHGAVLRPSVAYAYWDVCSTGGRPGANLGPAIPGDFDGSSPARPSAETRRHHDRRPLERRRLAEAPADPGDGEARRPTSIREVRRRRRARTTAAVPLRSHARLTKCSGAAGSGCLTEPQARALKRI